MRERNDVITRTIRAHRNGPAITAAWYVDGRPAVPSDYCAHGRLVCDRCAHDAGDPRPSQTWGATV